MKKQSLDISHEEFKGLPEVVKQAEQKKEEIPIFRFVNFSEYNQELIVDFHIAPISRMCEPKNHED